MYKSEQANKTLEKLLDSFRKGEISDAIQHTMLNTNRNVPCSKWSFNNQLICYLEGTMDARGFKQWKQVGRYIKKGSKAMYILVPLIKKGEDDVTGEHTTFVYGFRTTPVFAIEDTKGDALPDEQNKDVEPLEPPNLIEVTQVWGIDVAYVPFAGEIFGQYQKRKSGVERIILCTHDQDVFFHELAHAAHSRQRGGTLAKDPKGMAEQEIVAELTAAVIARMYGMETSGRNFRYIEHHAEKVNKDPYTMCIKVVKEVAGILSLIFDSLEQTEQAA